MNKIRLFNDTPVFVLGKCKRKDEGRVGHDVQCRPVRLGPGEYTFVTAPDCLEEIPSGCQAEPCRSPIACEGFGYCRLWNEKDT